MGCTAFVRHNLGRRRADSNLMAGGISDALRQGRGLSAVRLQARGLRMGLPGDRVEELVGGVRPCGPSEREMGRQHLRELIQEGETRGRLRGGRGRPGSPGQPVGRAGCGEPAAARRRTSGNPAGRRAPSIPGRGDERRPKPVPVVPQFRRSKSGLLFPMYDMALFGADDTSTRLRDVAPWSP